METRDLKSEQFTMERKLNDLSENEKRLNTVLSQKHSKRERQQLQDKEEEFDSMKYEYGLKVKELEQKYKESEAEKLAQLFEYEKNNAMWNMERDQLSDMRDQIEDQYQHESTLRKQLKRENEKLKLAKTGTNKKYQMHHVNISSSRENISKFSSKGSENSFASSTKKYGSPRYLMDSSNMKNTLEKKKGYNVGSSLKASYDMKKKSHW